VMESMRSVLSDVTLRPIRTMESDESSTQTVKREAGTMSAMVPMAIRHPTGRREVRTGDLIAS
jgi:hypothetical protein